MKGIDLSCASQASTAICLSMDIEASSSSSSSTIQLGGRAIDRHNPIIREGRRAAPCSSQPPINPKSYHQLQKPKKSSTSSKHNDQKKKSTSANTSTSSQAKLGDFVKTRSSSSSSSSSSSKSVPVDVVGRWSRGATKAADLVTPPGSSRYLLGDTAFLEGLSDYDPVLALVPVGNKRNQSAAATAAAAAAAEKKQDQSTATKDSSSSHHSKPPSSNQVVVLRVSLHCRGCEGKVRKHLSRMEGVTSFNIDFAAKKVTVVGDVTPLSVLASISKVKNAQFWTKEVVSSSPAPPPANSSLTILDDRKH